MRARVGQKADAFERFVKSCGLDIERRETGPVVGFHITRRVGPYSYDMHVMFKVGKRGGGFLGGTRYSILGKDHKLRDEQDARSWIRTIQPVQEEGQR